MQFPFSFVFSVPGIANPFASARPSQAPGMSKAVETMNGTEATKPIDVKAHSSRPPRLPRPPPPPSAISQTQTPSRKRGWTPAFSELSEPATVPASTSGYLDTPSKYRDLSMTPSNDETELEEMAADLPPPKRRKTLAGSIVSTALSAALIGTAVGLTVYRLWRGRGKEPEALPPPPYEQGEWTPPQRDPHEDSEFSDMHIINHSTPRQRKQRFVAGRRSVPRQRKALLRPPVSHSTYLSTPSASVAASTSSPSFSSPVQPEFNFASPDPSEPVVELEDQMDWMGSQLARLIEEGKRALNKEVVVMSERQEDAEDDGTGQWVDDGGAYASRSRSGSMRKHKRPRNVHVPSSPPSYTSPHSSPRKGRFDHSREGSHVPESLMQAPRGVSTESVRSRVSAHHEDEGAWETPELRESMERARRLYLQQRNHAT